MAQAGDLVPAVGRLGIGGALGIVPWVLSPRHCPQGIVGAVVAAAALPREAHELKLVIELLRKLIEGKLGERQV